jgi:hypothetical protein
MDRRFAERIRKLREQVIAGRCDSRTVALRAQDHQISQLTSYKRAVLAGSPSALLLVPPLQ